MIPKTIHQIWLGGKKIPKKLSEYRKTWKRFNPNYEVKIWREKEVNPLLAKYAKDKLFYNKDIIKNFSEKSDLARYLILYEQGGIYADMDFECLKPFDKFLKHKCFFGKQLDDNENIGSLYNGALIGAERKFPLIKRMIEDMEKRAAEKRNENSEQKLGPQFLQDSYNNCADKENIAIYEKEVFYPYNWKEKLKNADLRKSYAVHHWEISWAKKLPLFR